MIKNCIILSLLFGFVSISYKLQAQPEWQSKAEKSGLVIKEKKVACNDEPNGIYKEMVLLQFSNNSNATVAVSFKKEVISLGKVCANSFTFISI